MSKNLKKSDKKMTSDREKEIRDKECPISTAKLEIELFKRKAHLMKIRDQIDRYLRRYHAWENEL